MQRLASSFVMIEVIFTQKEKPENNYLTRIGNDKSSESQQAILSVTRPSLSIGGDSIKVIRFRFADRILLMLIANRL